MKKLYSIILSNNNRNFIYSVKDCLYNKYGVDVDVAINFIDAFNYLGTSDCDLMIVDTSSINISEDMVKILSSVESRFFVPNIVCVGDNNINGCDCIEFSDIESYFDKKIVDIYDVSYSSNVKIKDCSESKMSEYLIGLGFNTNQKGFYYIRDSLLYLISNGLNNNCLSRYVYTYLSRKYNKSIFSIEKDIRYSIKTTTQKYNFTTVSNVKSVLMLIANKYIASIKTG